MTKPEGATNKSGCIEFRGEGNFPHASKGISFNKEEVPLDKKAGDLDETGDLFDSTIISAPDSKLTISKSDVLKLSSVESSSTHASKGISFNASKDISFNASKGIFFSKEGIPLDKNTGDLDKTKVHLDSTITLAPGAKLIIPKSVALEFVKGHGNTIKIKILKGERPATIVLTSSEGDQHTMYYGEHEIKDSEGFYKCLSSTHVRIELSKDWSDADFATGESSEPTDLGDEAVGLSGEAVIESVVDSGGYTDF